MPRDLKLIVTDPVLLKALAKQGINPEHVDFVQDYASRSLGKEHSPYAKFYRMNDGSNQRFMVVSGLPMVDADSVKIEVGWRLAGINYFAEKNNLFRAKVQGKDVELIIRNDQPDGRKAGNRLSYKPQLFLNGIEQTCGNSVLLPVDPVNPNYLENTLEWDYGICKRRLRIIEGRVLGSWVFAHKPAGEVRIKYNQTGDYKLRLGQFKANDDEEVINSTDFDELAKFQDYPVTVRDSATFYPDAHPESTSVDGSIYVGPAGASWATICTSDGSVAQDSTAIYYPFYIQAEASTNLWRYLARGLFLFDSSALPDNAIIPAAVFSIRGYAKTDALGCTPNINIYSSNPASNIAIAAGDFDTLGNTPFCDTPITYAAYNTSGYNDFALNAAGIAAISKTNVTKLGIRNQNYDVAQTSPTWAANKDTEIDCYFSEQGTGYKPKLVVTYTIPPSLVKLGVKVIASRKVALKRISLVKLGVKVIASRKVALKRISLVKLGEKVIASRKVALKRISLVKLGVKVIASYDYTKGVIHYAYTSLVKIGIRVSSFRILNVSRSSLVKLGEKIIASRQINMVRSSLIKLGVKTISKRVSSITRSALNYIGLKVIASRQVALIRTALTKIGVKVIAWGIIPKVETLISLVLKLFGRSQTLKLKSQCLTLKTYEHNLTPLKLQDRNLSLKTYNHDITLKLE